MIIPPDPEKDPRLFDQSRTSLATDADLISLDEPAMPQVAYHRDLLYTGPFTDDYAVYHDEVLPPYDGRRGDATSNLQQRLRRSVRNSNLLDRVNSVASSSDNSLGSTASSSSSQATATPHGSAVPINLSSSVSPSSTLVAASQWETKPSPSPKRSGLKVSASPELRRIWTKHRRWIIILLFIVVAAVLLAAGLAAGIGVALSSKRPKTEQNSSSTKEKVWPGAPNASVQIGTLNITYVPRRDDPKPQDGVPSDCNEFAPLNMSSSLSQLALTSGYFDHYISTYQFPLANNTHNRTALEYPFYFIAHGLAASGTVEFIGTDATGSILEGGMEGVVQVDVLARSPKDRPLDTVAKICRLKRPDGSEGVGIYTPVETDSGGAGSAASYLLDPLQTPAFHVIIRLPPSTMMGLPNTSVSLSDVSFSLAGMGVRMGQLHSVAKFGSLSMVSDCIGAGIVVNHVVADSIFISGAQGTVQGTFNISESITVNSTSGAIFANVILHNPENLNDNSTTIESTIPMPKTKRGWHPPPPKPSYPPHNPEEWDDVDEYTSESPYTSESDYTSTMASTTTWHSTTTSTHASRTSSWDDAPEPASTSGTTTTWNGNDTVDEPVKLLARNHTITTTFVTKEGFIFIAYLHHPPTVAVQAFVASQSGMVDVSMHPNYVGAFALVNLWGSVRMPPLGWPVTSDPLNLGRWREVIQGPIDVSNSTFFGDQHNKFSETSDTAASSVTGAVMWTSDEFPVTSAKSAQNSPEGQGSALYALANLGDLQATFDGT